MKNTILDIMIVDDDPNLFPALEKILGAMDVTVRTSVSIEDAKQQLQVKIPDGLLIDLVLPDGSGLELVDFLKEEDTQIIIMTGYPSLDSAISGLRSNAVDYLIKPLEIARVRAWVKRLQSEHQLSAGMPENVRENSGFSGMIGSSRAIQRVCRLIEKVALSEITVLLQGESGTGKEVAARAIHQLSTRKDKPLLAFNCGAVNESLIADDLFGHERGGFTGANKQHKGYFERAHGCTLFLDEVTEMPIDLQAHLLRVLETGKLVRIGGDTEIMTDVRLIAATNRDPQKAVAEGKLREDLYYRLAVFPIQLPPLRERLEDIGELAHYFIHQLNETDGRSKTVTLDTINYLQTLNWKGNIRQFRNAIQRAHLLAENELRIADFEEFSPADLKVPSVAADRSIGSVERQLILATLEKHEDNKKTAAEELGISLKTLYNKLKKYELNDKKKQC